MTDTLQSSAWYRRDRRRFSKPLALLPACHPEAGGRWADVGCGDGIFTAVLADLLGSDGWVIGLDRDRTALRRFQRNMTEAGLNRRTSALIADFHRPVPWQAIDGLVAANALHFTRDAAKKKALTGLANSLRSGGQLVVVEYNHASGTAAVPHPLTASAWIELFRSVGLREVRLAARTPSRYLGEMVAITGRA